MTGDRRVRLSIHQKAELELYKQDRSLKAKFYDFCHEFRNDRRRHGLRLKQLKGESRLWSARIDADHRALLARVGTTESGVEDWLVVAVRHRRDVYEQMSMPVNRITRELEFIDLSVVGDSALRRAGINLTPAEPDSAPLAPHPGPTAAEAVEGKARPAAPLLSAHTAAELRDLGVAESLIGLALAVENSVELDQLVADAPLLSKDVLYGLAAGMSVEDVLGEITAQVAVSLPVDTSDFPAALDRTPATAVTTSDEQLRAILGEGTFREWKVFLHPAQRSIAYRDYSGPARVSGGPGTGKTIVALHRVACLAHRLPADPQARILLTTFTRNLALDLRARLAALLEPALMSRVDIMNVDALCARAVGEGAGPGRARGRVDDWAAQKELRALLDELGTLSWDAEFVMDEWEQVVLGQSLSTRAEYFKARRAGRGRALTRRERAEIWLIIEQLTARLSKAGVETWAQTAARAARHEVERAARVQERAADGAGGSDSDSDSGSGSGAREQRRRYRHIVVDEAQDLRSSHWTMLRAMVAPGQNDLFIAGDTHQRIYGNQASLGALGIHIRGRSSRLTLSYRTTREILAQALTVLSGETFDDLDDGFDTLAGYRSVLRGPGPTLQGFTDWNEELAALATRLGQWRQEISDSGDVSHSDVRGLIAVCATDLASVNSVVDYLTGKGISCSELTKDGPKGDGEVHVGTMHRFKGLEYQKMAIVGLRDGAFPRPGIQRYRESDPARYRRELRKARSLLFVAATRARDGLALTWHGAQSSLLSPERVAYPPA